MTDLRRIYVTGSSGKSTICRMLEACLSAEFGQGAAQQMRMDRYLKLRPGLDGVQFLILEVSIRQMNWVSRLEPADVVAIANVGGDHFDAVAPGDIETTVQAIAAIKARLLGTLKSSGTAVINADQPEYFWHYRQALEGRDARTVFAGEAAQSLVRLVDVVGDGESQRVRVDVAEQRYSLTTTVFGKHSVANMLTTLGVLFSLDVDVARGCSILAAHRAADGSGRVCVVHTRAGPIVLVDDTGGATAFSVIATLRALSRWAVPARRRIAVLGRVSSLGHATSGFCREIASCVRLEPLEQLLLLGSQLHDLRGLLEVPAPEWFGHKERLADELLHRLRPFDVVLFKGAPRVEEVCLQAVFQRVKAGLEEG